MGKVEKIILGPDGRPRQVLVRVDRVLRTLPVEALQPSGKTYAAVLTRAEIAALPPAGLSGSGRCALASRAINFEKL